MLELNKIHNGEALTVLETFEPESIDCCVTSPPYWALRDYKVEGQLGLEPTFQEYIDKLCFIFDQVKRVLKKTGACWVVMGDTYYSAGKSGDFAGDWERPSRNENSRTGINKMCLVCEKAFVGKPSARFCSHECVNILSNEQRVKGKSLPQKSLCMIPERFAIEMISRGWILRNKIIWHKPNCMPSSAKDRFTVDWEYVFFFTKSQKYYFETQYEHHEDNAINRKRHTVVGGTKYPLAGMQSGNQCTVAPYVNRIKRCVWKISTKPFSGAHFAVFPPELIETPIKATCPEYVCTKCGEARKLIYEETRINTRTGLNTKLNPDRQDKGNPFRPMIVNRNAEVSDCGCGAPFESGVVLDCFMGAGTTALVALKNARRFIGIEINSDYIKLAYKRLEPHLLQSKLCIENVISNT